MNTLWHTDGHFFFFHWGPSATKLAIPVILGYYAALKMIQAERREGKKKRGIYWRGTTPLTWRCQGLGTSASVDRCSSVVAHYLLGQTDASTGQFWQKMTEQCDKKRRPAGIAQCDLKSVPVQRRPFHEAGASQGRSAATTSLHTHHMATNTGGSDPNVSTLLLPLKRTIPCSIAISVFFTAMPTPTKAYHTMFNSYF